MNPKQYVVSITKRCFTFRPKYFSFPYDPGAKLAVHRIPCGEFANESERAAVERLKSDLATVSGEWIILSNVPHSVTTQAVPDDVDLIVIGPSVLHFIEVKHWDASYVKSFGDTVTREANKLANNIRRIARKLTKSGIDAGFGTIGVAAPSRLREPARCDQKRWTAGVRSDVVVVDGGPGLEGVGNSGRFFRGGELHVELAAEVLVG